jgi:ATP-dependent Clp protease ATP-binding subunit ClpX
MVRSGFCRQDEGLNYVAGELVARAHVRGSGIGGLPRPCLSLAIRSHDLQNIRHVLISAATVRGEQPAMYWSRGEGAAFWETWAAEEAQAEKAGQRTI